jgi:hypothetical protein
VSNRVDHEMLLEFLAGGCQNSLEVVRAEIADRRADRWRDIESAGSRELRAGYNIGHNRNASA